MTKLVNLRFFDRPRNWWNVVQFYPLPRDDMGGQAGNSIKLRGGLLQWLKDLNRNDPAVLQWLIKETKDGVYLTMGKGEWDTASEIYWPMIGIGGNCIEVDEKPVTGLRRVKFYRVTGLPLPGTPLDECDFVLTPEVVHRLYCGFPKIHDAPKGISFMPVFDPSKFPANDFTGGNLHDNPKFGLWVRVIDTLPYDPVYPIPLPDDWDKPPEEDEQPAMHRTYTQLTVHFGVNGLRRGVLGGDKLFSLMGTTQDAKGQIWGQIAGGRWIILFRVERRTGRSYYTTTWRPDGR